MLKFNSIKILRVALYVVCGIILFFLVAPTFIVIPISFSSSRFLEFPPKEYSFQWYQEYFLSHKWLSATYLSFKVATITMLISTIIGTLAAFGLVRGNFRGKIIIYSIILSPMIVPFVIVAVALYFFYARLHLIGNDFALIFAHVAITSPFVVIVVSSTLQGFDESLEYAAQNLGATRLKTFFLVTFPLIRPGVIAGGLFAFIISFDELLIALFICGHKGTIPKVMWEGIRVQITPTIAAVSSLLIVFSLIFFGSATILKKKS